MKELPGMKELPYKDRLKQLSLWTLEERRNRADLLEMFKMLIGKSSPKFELLFESAWLFAKKIVSHQFTRILRICT